MKKTKIEGETSLQPGEIGDSMGYIASRCAGTLKSGGDGYEQNINIIKVRFLETVKSFKLDKELSHL